jgi:hypothetical protein
MEDEHEDKHEDEAGRWKAQRELRALEKPRKNKCR